jgi:hypothetical protein
MILVVEEKKRRRGRSAWAGERYAPPQESQVATAPHTNRIA